MDEVLAEATLMRPEVRFDVHLGGKQGRHTEHLGFILAPMQFLQHAKALLHDAAVELHGNLSQNARTRNLDAFHEAFGTTESDLMWLDPQERVRIW